MTSDALLVLKTLFQTIWALFSSWHIPGTNVTPAGAFLFLASTGLVFRFIPRLFGVTSQAASMPSRSAPSSPKPERSYSSYDTTSSVSYTRYI